MEILLTVMASLGCIAMMGAAMALNSLSVVLNGNRLRGWRP